MSDKRDLSSEEQEFTFLDNEDGEEQGQPESPEVASDRSDVEEDAVEDVVEDEGSQAAADSGFDASESDGPVAANRFDAVKDAAEDMIEGEGVQAGPDSGFAASDEAPEYGHQPFLQKPESRNAAASFFKDKRKVGLFVGLPLVAAVLVGGGIAAFSGSQGPQAPVGQFESESEFAADVGSGSQGGGDSDFTGQPLAQASEPVEPEVVGMTQEEIEDLVDRRVSDILQGVAEAPAVDVNMPDFNELVQALAVTPQEMQLAARNINTNHDRINELAEALQGFADEMDAVHSEVSGVNSSSEVSSEDIERFAQQLQEMDTLASQVDRLLRNEGWVFNRLDSLEATVEEWQETVDMAHVMIHDGGQPEASNSSGQSSSQSVRSCLGDWGIVGLAQSARAVVEHRPTGDRKLVMEGRTIEGVGLVEGVISNSDGGYVQTVAGRICR